MGLLLLAQTTDLYYTLMVLIRGRCAALCFSLLLSSCIVHTQTRIEVGADPHSERQTLFFFFFSAGLLYKRDRDEDSRGKCVRVLPAFGESSFIRLNQRTERETGVTAHSWIAPRCWLCNENYSDGRRVQKGRLRSVAGEFDWVL